MEDTKPTRRRLLQFSVGSLMLLMLVMAIGLGYVRQRAAEQRQVVESLRQLGVDVHYPWEVKGSDCFPTFSGRPSAFADWIGVDYLYEPVSVTIQDPTVAAKAGPYLRKLRGLQMIWVYAVSDDVDEHWFEYLPDVKVGFLLEELLLRSVQMQKPVVGCVTIAPEDGPQTPP